MAVQGYLKLVLSGIFPLEVVLACLKLVLLKLLPSFT